MKPIQQWLSEYAESHQNPTNKLVHWFCVPAIFWSVIALLYSVKFDLGTTEVNLALLVAAAVIVYYALMSLTLSVGMMLFTIACLYICHLIELKSAFPLWAVALTVFVLAWIVQIWGHKVEGKKPSFIKDLQFLMIGPAWVMAFIYKKAGISL